MLSSADLPAAASFSAADRIAVRATTEAGLAALEAQMHASEARGVDQLVGREPDRLAKIASEPAQPWVAIQAERLRAPTGASLTLALLGPGLQLLAADGPVPPSPEMLQALKGIPLDEGAVLSVLHERELYVAALSRGEPSGHRWLALDPLPTGPGTRFQRALGRDTEAALVQGGRLLGEVIGDPSVGEVMENLAVEHQLQTPQAGASEVFTTRSDSERRLGALGRVPGLAGEEPTPVLLVVLSPVALVGEPPRLWAAVAQAAAHPLAPVTLGLLGGLLLLSCTLAWILPQLESTGPLRRLQQELDALARGEQHHLRCEQYGGAPGNVARATARLLETMRHATVRDSIDIPDYDPPEVEPLPPVESEPATTRERPLHEAAVQPFGARSVGTADSGLQTISLEHRAAPVDEAGISDVWPEITSGMAAQSGVGNRDDYYREVYEEFLQVKSACGEPIEALTFDRFTAKLRRNEEDLRARRNDVRGVRFSVYVKDGRAALKAKVVKI